MFLHLIALVFCMVSLLYCLFLLTTGKSTSERSPRSYIASNETSENKVLHSAGWIVTVYLNLNVLSSLTADTVCYTSRSI